MSIEHNTFKKVGTSTNIHKETYARFYMCMNVHVLINVFLASIQVQHYNYTYELLILLSLINNKRAH